MASPNMPHSYRITPKMAKNWDAFRAKADAPDIAKRKANAERLKEWRAAHPNATIDEVIAYAESIV